MAKKINFSGMEINELLVDGNAKIGKGCFHFSTLPTNKPYTHSKLGFTTSGTCPLTCKGCYGTTGNYRFSNVKDALAIRTLVARTDLDFFISEINAEIKKHKIEKIRIHATGDFFSNEYVLAWVEIAKANPQVTFWTYTKTSFPALAILNRLENVNIVNSLIPGKGFNFGHCGYIMDTYKELKESGENPYICKCGTDKNQHCTNCDGCSKHKYVLFIEHSTEYKAEKDPLFVDIKSLIESQK